MSRATKPAAPRLGRADGPAVGGVAMTGLGEMKQKQWRSSYSRGATPGGGAVSERMANPETGE